MVFTEYKIEQPIKYPESMESQGPYKGPLMVMVAAQKGVDPVDPESMGIRTAEVVAKYGSHEDAKDAFEAGRMQADPEYQRRRRARIVRDWFMSKSPAVELVEKRDNAGVLEGYVVVMSLLDQRTGLTQVKHRYVSMDEIAKGLGV